MTIPMPHLSRRVSPQRAPVSTNAGVRESPGAEKAKSTRFQMPLDVKAVLIFVGFVAIASIGRIDEAISLHAGLQTGGYQSLRSLASIDSKRYTRKPHQPRLVFLDGSPWTSKAENRSGSPRQVPSMQLRYRSSKIDDEDENIDNTRFYDQLDSADVPGMERRQWPQHDFDPDCEPMAKWQSEFHPVCNEIHTVADVQQSLVDDDLSLLGNGFWRHAWRHEDGGKSATTTVWKTFK